MVTRGDEDDSLGALRARAAELRRRLAHRPTAPTASSSTLAPFPSTNSSTGSGVLHRADTAFEPDALVETQELVRKYRLGGRSCFPVELARGNRAKEELREVRQERKRRKGSAKGRGKAWEEETEDEGASEEDEGFVRKGTAVRLETFFNGRYYEPYFVVFARRLPNLDDPAPSSARPLFIAHHTVPHWVPLDHLASRYLGISLDGQDDGAEGEDVDFRGGEPDLELFLTRLTPYLNAFVSRREQLVSLRSAYSPATHPSLDLRIFASESCDRVMVEWNLWRPRTEEDDEDEDGEDATPDRRVIVQVAFHDLCVERFEETDGREEASLLVRYVERDPAEGFSPQLVRQKLASATRRRAGRAATMDAVVRLLVEETTREGWDAHVEDES